MYKPTRAALTHMTMVVSVTGMVVSIHVDVQRAEMEVNFNVSQFSVIQVYKKSLTSPKQDF